MNRTPETLLSTQPSMLGVANTIVFDSIVETSSTWFQVLLFFIFIFYFLLAAIYGDLWTWIYFSLITPYLVSFLLGCREETQSRNQKAILSQGYLERVQASTTSDSETHQSQ